MSCCCQPAPVAVPLAASCCASARKNKAANGSEWAVLGVLILLSGLTMNVSLAVNLSALAGDTRLVIHGLLAAAGVLALLLGGHDLFAPAWRALKQRRIVTEHLFLAGIFAAWSVSVHATLTGSGAVFYEVPVLLPAIRRFGSILLARQRTRIDDAAHELLTGIASARVWQQEGWHMSPLSAVVVGDRLLVRAGETIPADATITAGRAYVQTRALTGEPFPAALETGAAVSAGMIVLDGELELSVHTATSELAHLAASTQALLEQPPAFLRSVEKVLRWFFPVLLIVSMATLIFWAWHSGWPTAISHSLAVILVACPCAFGMALPLLFRRGLASCLRRGIEPADAAFMESLSLVRVVAFDKTGTLTVPDMTVASLICAPEVDEATVRAMLAALHRRSTHPVARPFWRWIAEAQDIEVRDLCVEPGRGIAVQVKLHGDWMRVRLGHETFMQEPLPTWATSPEPQRRMFLELNGTLASVCLLTEELRASAVTACAQLSAAGYRTALLTGDATLPAEFAHAFDEARTSQRPAEKAGIISHWERSGLPVIFIGDGLNDAPALATATCSIAIGDSAALASASAQARWQQPEFAALPGLLEEARALDTRARLILRVALTYNTLGIIIAAVGLLHPAAAAVLMLLSSATVMALAARPLDGVFTPSSNPQKPPTLVKLQSSFA